MTRSRSKPNIVFFFTDDQRHDTIAALGNSEIKTPTLDSLVERGTAFTNAHIMGGTNGAVCMPSRAMLMTGRTLFHLDDPANPPTVAQLFGPADKSRQEDSIDAHMPAIQAGKHIPPSFRTMPEALRASGYYTYHVGKWHQDRESFNRSFVDGARIFGFTNGWYKTYGGHWNVALHDYDPTCVYPEDRGYMLAADKVTKAPIGPGAGGVHSSELFADAAIDFVNGYSEPDPFFLYLSFVAPHDPRQAPDEYEEMYQPSDITLPSNYLPEHPFDNGDLYVRDERLEGWPRRKRAVKDHISDYYGIISHADSQIGRVIDALKSRNLYENTIIVFAGDNGLAVGQHGLMGKQSLYEHSSGVPLIFAGPGIPEGRRSDALCYLLDIFPTLCDLSDVTTPESVEGRSLAPAIENNDTEIRSHLYFGYKGCQRAVRDKRYKLIEYVSDSGRNTQLFDLENDPWEMENLADDPGYSEHIKKLMTELFSRRDAVDDHQETFGKYFWSRY